MEVKKIGLDGNIFIFQNNRKLSYHQKFIIRKLSSPKIIVGFKNIKSDRGKVYLLEIKWIKYHIFLQVLFYKLTKLLNIIHLRAEISQLYYFFYENWR